MLTAGADGFSQFARAVKEALGTGAYIQLHIQMPMDGTAIADENEDLGHLSRFADSEFSHQQHDGVTKLNAFSSWDAWNVIRSVCKYHGRLSVGKKDQSVQSLLAL